MALVVKNLSANAGDRKRCRIDPWIRKIPWRREWQPPAKFLPGECHGPRGLVDYVHGVTESQTCWATKQSTVRGCVSCTDHQVLLFSGLVNPHMKVLSHKHSQELFPPMALVECIKTCPSS